MSSKEIISAVKIKGQIFALEDEIGYEIRSLSRHFEGIKNDYGYAQLGAAIEKAGRSIELMRDLLAALQEFKPKSK